ncbi:MAG TPA: hypothetical protein VGM41_14315 [Chitinophagaceae bacterium]|jgi:hypothetical protein
MLYAIVKWHIKVLLFVCIQCLYLNASAQQMTPKPSWLKDTVIAGISVQQLRVPKEEITSRWITHILFIQRDLDQDLKRARAWERVGFNGTSAEIMFIRNQEPSWPVEYYQKEMDAYEAYNNTIPAHEQKIVDSIVKVNDEKERLAALVKGYCFISKPFIIIRETAIDGGHTMGKLYFGTYVKVEDADDGGTAYVTVPGLPGVEGIIHTSDYVDSLYKLKATDEEMSILKSRRYAKFEIDPVYAAAIKKEQQAEARREQAASRSTSRSSKRRTYITGPRGGCYYINSNGNKVYVDHSFCQ